MYATVVIVKYRNLSRDLPTIYKSTGGNYKNECLISTEKKYNTLV